MLFRIHARQNRRNRRTISPFKLAEALEARCLLSGTFDISGVQSAALDQPRINAFFRFNPTDAPLTASDPSTGLSTFNVTAFLDTGTSEVLLSQETSSALGINADTYNGQTIQFSDTGIAGSGAFNVSQPLYFATAASSDPNVDDPTMYQTVYNQTFGPVRAELNPDAADPTLGDPLDIIGMPGLQNKTMVVDARPLNDPNNFNLLNTYVYSPGTPYDAVNDATNPGIVPGNFHIRVSQADFSSFAAIDPPGAPGASFANNPIIGANPLLPATPNSPPGITITNGAYSATGNFLFDTGAAASFISQDMAAQLHVHYKDGTYNNSDPNVTPDLVDDNGNDLPNQFTLPIGGIGGTITAAGFYLTSMILPTVEGEPIRFISAPVLVLDVTVQNPVTNQLLTLDGDFGMNYLVASTDISDGGLGTTNAGAFDWITFDQQEGLIGLNVANTPTTPTVLSRHVFYNNSSFDGNNPAANAADAGAIAWDKSPLLPGQTASFANYTSYSKGINGVMVDVSGLPATTLSAAADFSFKVGNSSAAGGWVAAPAPSAITVLPGIGADGSDRVEITWPDGSIKKEWLQVTVKADGSTGLAAPDVFYFGNAPGETGNSAANAAVTVADALIARAHPSSASPITSNFDFNRDGAVNAADVLIVRSNLSAGPEVLQLISAPSITPALSAANLRTTSAGALGQSTNGRGHFAPNHRNGVIVLHPIARPRIKLPATVRILANLPGIRGTGGSPVALSPVSPVEPTAAPSKAPAGVARSSIRQPGMPHRLSAPSFDSAFADHPLYALPEVEDDAAILDGGTRGVLAFENRTHLLRLARSHAR
ncbi:MAG TPA: hypothetical protein VFC78_20880 [Tepidisphaeraceae bacterium]|nr:hypothetical protein [Tepidisphaeraceae bacterium]